MKQDLEEFLREFISTRLWKKYNFSDLRFTINHNGNFEVFDSISSRKIYGRKICPLNSLY